MKPGKLSAIPGQKLFLRLTIDAGTIIPGMVLDTLK